MTDASRFWDKTADRYARKPVKDEESYRRTLEATRKHLSASDRVLELGCGTGTTALMLSADVKEIVASDISSRMIEIAREKGRAQGVENVRFQRASLVDASPEHGTFDAVLAFNLLHLLEDLSGAVRGVHGLLRSGGLFIAKTVCLGEQSRLWRPVLALATALRVAPYVRCLTISELEGIVVGEGFRIVETGLYPPSPPSHFIVARKS